MAGLLTALDMRMNIITIPPPGAGLVTKGSITSGEMSNGYTRIFADATPGAVGVDITFSVELNAVLAPAFRDWRGQVSKIFTPSVESEIARFSGIVPGADQAERYASRYSLAAFSYVMTGKFNGFHNQGDVHYSFDSPTSASQEQGARLMNSIRDLHSSMIKLGGKLTATAAHPHSQAFISATYFAFADTKVTSFAGYRGPIFLVNGNEQVATPAGILAPV